MKQRFQNFMYGRYGSDNFSNFLLGTALVLLILGMFLSGIFTILAFAVLIYSYYRMFSKKTYARAHENEVYLAKTEGIRKKWRGFWSRMKTRKTHHIYTCPNCKQKIRIPKGKGHIRITCPKCQTSFEKNS
ncbi:MAG: zinc-ribbon domain-containing protein [Lachnospiraceae bacterium]|nr:zinc-ribbon domain-containing protein [Lachnospiraceae bacterium]